MDDSTTNCSYFQYKVPKSRFAGTLRLVLESSWIRVTRVGELLLVLALVLEEYCQPVLG